MVLEQKMSENTAGAGQPDLHSAHTKKMSLATKLKKQRRNRQSDSKSPVTTAARNSGEVPSSSSMASKSPTRNVAKAEDQVVQSKTSEESNTSATSNTTGGTNDTPGKKSSSGASVGASLLHNKRRAMNLAKNKKAYQQQKSAVLAAQNQTSEEPTSGVNATKSCPSTSSVTTTESDAHDVTPTHSDDSETPNVTSAGSDESELARIQVNAPDDTPQETGLKKDARSKEENDLSDRFSQVSLDSTKARSVISNGVVAYDDSIMSIARLDNFRSKANQDKAKQKQAYPGSSGLKEQQNSFESSASQQSEPASQPWKTRNSDISNNLGCKNARGSPATVSEAPGDGDLQENRRKFSRQPSWAKTRGQQDEYLASPTPSNYSTNTEQPQASPARSTFSTASSGIERGGSDSLMVPKFSSSNSDTALQNSFLRVPIRAKTWKPSPSVKSYVPQAGKQEQVCPDSPTTSWPSTNGDQQTCPSSPSPSQISEVDSAVERPSDDVPKAKTWKAKKQTPSWMNKRNSSPNLMSQQEPQPSTPSWAKQKQVSSHGESHDTKSSTSKLRSAQGAPGRSPPLPKPMNRHNQTAGAPEPVRPSISSASPRRHSAPRAKPSGDESEIDEKKQVTPAPVASAKTWAVNKETPAWMKKVQGDSAQEAERAPSPVPTTKTFTVKKQSPAWMKQTDSADDEHEEQRTVEAPSPRRHSGPGRKKAPDDQEKPNLPVAPSPKTSGWKKPSPLASEAGKPSSPVQNNKGNWQGRSSNGKQQAKSVVSPRRQSWGGNRSPSPSVEKSSIGPSSSWKVRASEKPKVPSSPALPKKQRCPSPSVMQLQNEIFANKLGVIESGIHDSSKTKTTEHGRAPASPAPRVVELQEKIFSPEKEKCPSPSSERLDPKSNAQGWWKRVPNAPQIDTMHNEEALTNVDPQISSTRNGGQSQAPSVSAWKKPVLNANAPGTPSWLKDVAAFHEASSPKLPEEPPVYQQPESSQQTKLTDPKSGSFSEKKHADESSCDLMIMSSTSTTSRDDVAMQQEETKSLIQMAADSVLIADYEQAMKRIATESKSYDEDESEHGGPAEPALPSDLPAEFQKAFTTEEDVGGQESSLSSQKVAGSSGAIEDQETKTSEEVSSQPQCREIIPSSPDIQSKAESPRYDSGVCKKSMSIDKSAEAYPKKENTEDKMQRSEGTTDSSVLVFGDPNSYRADGSDEDCAPRVSDRAKALSGWAETRLDTPQRAEKRSVDIENAFDNSSSKISASESNKYRTLSNVVYDENGFPCTPFTDENIPVTFEKNDFSSRQWIEELDDEKKDSEPLEYWHVDPLYELNDASASEWINRDPGLDMIPMHSPEAVSTHRKKLTAEMLQEHFASGKERASINAVLDDNWIHVSGGSCLSTKENIGPSQAGSKKTHPGQQASTQHDPTELVSTPDRTRRGDTRGIAEQSPALDATWGLQASTQNDPTDIVSTPDQAQRKNTQGIEAQSRPCASDPMWGSYPSLDATWGSPDPFTPASIGHFDRMTSDEKRADAKALGDAFDPFGDEGDLMQFSGEKLFSVPTEAFVVPPAFGNEGTREHHHTPVLQNDGFDTFYCPQGIPLKPVSQDDE